MDKLPILMTQVFPRCVQCAICGVEMYAEKTNEKEPWHYPHRRFEEGCGSCQNEGLKFSVTSFPVRVVR